MTGPVANSTSREPLTPPRHPVKHPGNLIKRYEDNLKEAELRAAEALDRLLADYLRILEIAGNAYARETERAMRAYNTIENPARRVYESQQDIAENAYNSIMEPAKAELDRIARAAHDMYQRAIVPIETAYAQAVNDAASITQNITIPQVPQA